MEPILALGLGTDLRRSQSFGGLLNEWFGINALTHHLVKTQTIHIKRVSNGKIIFKVLERWTWVLAD